MTARHMPHNTVLTRPAVTRSVNAVQPVLLGPLADGDLCDIVVGGQAGKRRYCHADGTVEVTDTDGRHRILCDEHRAMYFPQAGVS